MIQTSILHRNFDNCSYGFTSEIVNELNNQWQEFHEELINAAMTGELPAEFYDQLRAKAEVSELSELECEILYAYERRLEENRHNVN